MIRTVCTYKVSENTELGEVANALEDRIKVQNDLDKLEAWCELHRIKFS